LLWLTLIRGSWPRMWSLDSQVWPHRYISSGAAHVTNLPLSSNLLSDNDLREVASNGAVSMPTALESGMPSSFRLTRKLGSKIRITHSILALILVLSPRLAAGAQGYEGMQPMATRGDLTTLADRLSRGSEVDRNKATILRARLREGDFRAGDRIRLVLDGSVTQDDTVSVIAGSKIALKDVGEIPLAGVLRSELQGHLSTYIAKYIRDVRVRATPLVRLSILGPVAKPGFFYMPPDIPIGDAIMRAGGPVATTDLSRSVIRRNTTELYDSRNTHTAMDQGLTLDQLSLRDGDSIEVGEKTTGGWQKIASIVGVATSLIWALTYVSRR
jgi:protein involved in polysaccharide export with SLBB domain